MGPDPQGRAQRSRPNFTLANEWGKSFDGARKMLLGKKRWFVTGGKADFLALISQATVNPPLNLLTFHSIRHFPPIQHPLNR